MATDRTERPEDVTDEHLEYLDRLRELGIVNMFGAGSYLQDEYDVDSTTATSILSYWMRTFSERHPQRGA